MKILIESDHPYERLADYVPFVDAGMDVVVCGGPAPDQTCALLDGQLCSLVDEADAVLNDVDDEETQLAIAQAVRATSPDLPMVVVMPPGADVELPPGCVRYADDARTVNHADRASVVRSKATGPEWLVPPWQWPAERPAVRFSPELRTAGELVGTQSTLEPPLSGSKHAA